MEANVKRFYSKYNKNNCQPKNVNCQKWRYMLLFLLTVIIYKLLVFVYSRSAVVQVTAHDNHETNVLSRRWSVRVYRVCMLSIIITVT